MRVRNTPKPVIKSDQGPPLREAQSRSSHHVGLGIVGAVCLAVVLVLLLVSPAFAFTDTAGSPYITAITDLSSRNIITGFTDGTFRPNSNVTRQQFAKMIVLTLGYTVTLNDTCVFTDVDKGLSQIDPLYPYNYVAVCAAHLITEGVTPTQFAPTKNVTRAQLITMVARAADLLDPPVDYAPPFGNFSTTHYPWARKAAYAGLLDGLAGMGQSYDFFQYATRGECAQLLYNLSSILQPAGPYVAADGSGDYPTIEDAVANIDTGQTIYLGPGTFHLSDTLLVDFSFNLVGSGIDKTTVTCNGTVVDVESVSFGAQDIAFQSTATSVATDAMDANDATIDLESCGFTGGSRVNDHEGDGLYLHGTTTGTVAGCASGYNDNNGIDVDEQAHVTLENNACSFNGADGINFWGSSVGVASGNTCDSNVYSGIGANEHAQATLEDNECSDNESDGIQFWDSSSGTATGNTCSGNAYNGVSANDSSNVTLENNDCSDNQDNGILFTKTATGTIQNNTCSGSKTYDGIGLYDDSHALIESNTCLNNAEAGIYFADRSYGTARTNECAGNQWGIYVRSTASPTFSGNNLHDNTINPQLYDERTL